MKVDFKEFVNFATLNSENHRSARCPCTECYKVEFHTPERIKGYLFQNNFMWTYVAWDKYREVDSNIVLFLKSRILVARSP